MGSMACHKCETVFEADPKRDVGTIWQPLFACYCPSCQALMPDLRD